MASLQRRRDPMVALLVLLSTALLVGVRAYAASRGSRITNADAAHLPTDEAAQNDGGVAGTPPTATIRIVPVPAKVGPPYPPLADGGPNIVGNELRLDAGGVRAWFELQIFGWDPNGDHVPALRVFQAVIDSTGYLDADTNGNGDVTDDGDQPDLAPAVVPCVNRSDCRAAFGERVAECECEAWNATGCERGECKAGYLDEKGTSGRPDAFCAWPPSCGGGDVDTRSLDYLFFAIADGVREDLGVIYWGGTLVLDIPPDAKGKYKVNLNQQRTFLADSSAPPRDIPTAAETGFVVNVLTGACCFGLGTPDEGCVDGVLRSECGDDEPGPVDFTPGAQCPPVGPGCTPHLGACCNTLDGSCDDGVLQSHCAGALQVWSSDTACIDAACVSNFGACCDTLHGSCGDSVQQGDCAGGHKVWTRGTACDNAACLSDTGACCDHNPFGPCIDDTVSSDCRCATCTWYKHQACAEIECAQTPIPTVSEWGLAILTLLLLTAGKVYFGRRGMMHGDMLFPLRRMERAESTDGP